MHQHFDKHLNVRELLRAKKPRVVVELGAGSGNNTKQILELQEEFPFKMTVVNDGNTPTDLPSWKGLTWINGISYLEIGLIPGPIDFCSIDTDHNYWTLREELRSLEPKMKTGGIVVMHDTDTYGKTSGHFWDYVTDYPYPLEQIELWEKEGKTMTDAISEMTQSGSFKVIKETKESHGAIALERL